MNGLKSICLVRFVGLGKLLSLVRLVFFLALLVAASVSGAVTINAKTAKHIIIIENMLYTPNELMLTRGDQVEWVNKDLVPHSVTSTDKEFNSGSIAPGAHYRIRITAKQNIDYKCSFHRTMKAKLIVH